MPKTIEERADAWDKSGTGASARTIYLFFREGRYDCPSYPHDAGDFGRCESLLNMVPEWEDRLMEMAILPGTVGAA